MSTGKGSTELKVETFKNCYKITKQRNICEQNIIGCAMTEITKQIGHLLLCNPICLDEYATQVYL